ncbi:MAG: N-6 DNA methylase [Thermaerobacter sp.]|nr:N-6 DNA methylase [Thermaerobacter sp.]
MDLLETYLRQLWEVRATGAGLPEPSHYPALANLLNGVGEKLRPKVRCVLQLKNRGAGVPDGGFFTPDQLRRGSETSPLLGQVPSRGVVEVKKTGEDVRKVVGSTQVAGYLDKYGQILVTNYRDFLLMTRGVGGQPALGEVYRLADSEESFWSAAAHPRSMASEHRGRFEEYLCRVLLHAAPLAAPEDVAWFLASYAREAKRRVEGLELPALSAVRSSMEDTLGLKFEGDKGEHFFRSTLVQTLFYGMFAAWVLWSRHRLATDRREQFDWRTAAWSLRVPMVRALFEQVATPSRLGPLRLEEVLDWSAAALNRVDRPAFFTRFAEEHAVQYFYEPFLNAFDPDLRKELGVWYTPPEVVRYMVARVDRVLREEMGIADGFADPCVYVLDPCAGTGSFLVEVLRRIAATLREKGQDALTADDVKQAALERIYGFEILPAPFVVAHLQLGLLLESLGAPLSVVGDERAGVYLTNALTGWEPPKGPHKQLTIPFPELEQEREAAEHVKREQPILVIMGNPPYNSFAGIAMGEERALSEAYRTTASTRRPQGQGLNDLYVRFFRMAERRIVEKTGRGVVCFISNYSWLDGLSFNGMRERYLGVFDRIWIDCLNGDKYKTGKLTPEGEPDPSIFSTTRNPEGIQVGTAVALLVRRDPHTPAGAVWFRNFWGRNKRAELLEAVMDGGKSEYLALQPPQEMDFPFVPSSSESSYFLWPQLPDLFPVSFAGVKTSRDSFLTDMDRDRLVGRVRWYFDPAVSHEEIRKAFPKVMENIASFDATATRAWLLERGFLLEGVVRYLYRPFDVRWLYWEPETKLLDGKRADYRQQVFEGNFWLSASKRNRKEDLNRSQYTSCLADINAVDSGISMFPLYLRGESTSFIPDAGVRPNLSERARAYLKDLLADEKTLFYHCVAVLHAPAYSTRNTGALRQGWPRMPLPDTFEKLAASAELGWRVATLIDVEQAAGPLTPGMDRIAIIACEGGGELHPEAGDLTLEVGWGHLGPGDVAMPGAGKVAERDYAPEERAELEKTAKALGLAPEDVNTCLGVTTFDVFLNDRAYWRNVPSKVWEYTLGGYQVLKKWLSYRQKEILDRSLSKEEVRQLSDIAQRIATLLMLGPSLDANYAAVKASVWAGPSAEGRERAQEAAPDMAAEKEPEYGVE